MNSVSQLTWEVARSLYRGAVGSAGLHQHVCLHTGAAKGACSCQGCRKRCIGNNLPGKPLSWISDGSRTGRRFVWRYQSLSLRVCIEFTQSLF